MKKRNRVIALLLAFVLVLTSVTYTAMDVSASSMSVQEMEVVYKEE